MSKEDMYHAVRQDTRRSSTRGAADVPARYGRTSGNSYINREGDGDRDRDRDRYRYRDRYRDRNRNRERWEDKGERSYDRYHDESYSRYSRHDSRYSCRDYDEAAASATVTNDSRYHYNDRRRYQRHHNYDTDPPRYRGHETDSREQHYRQHGRYVGSTYSSGANESATAHKQGDGSGNRTRNAEYSAAGATESAPQSLPVPVVETVGKVSTVGQGVGDKDPVRSADGMRGLLPLEELERLAGPQTRSDTDTDDDDSSAGSDDSSSNRDGTLKCRKRLLLRLLERQQ
uniref:Uncharacterized protein n=1 Tax=Lygus hesperus TaxID=30085 RepID=A0A146KP06_LYGHE